ncbi:SDR family NAD(P)-dependent oxidoreductase [Aestuariibaculum sediminum]|uniref:SDR family oxidoreductase n=1 Tax=Aestuariibaculum sediminum TaxID=2770637 RepID=A0A8J6Q6B7_9FLAO|nr:SDR family oxidoreductase [Aestuariibaculum sediminum]MBD0830570.1 SDR family oxidoreductase [Aestuariibaculum sediminum]
MTKTALITGAASGLGYEIALLLANDHYDLILIDIHEENLKCTQKHIKETYGNKVDILVKDLSKIDVASEIMLDIGGVTVDVLINNAGFGLFGLFVDTDWKRELDMLHVHILTTTHLTKLILEGMVKQGSGKILNVSSLAAFQPGPLMSIYYASKSYILSFSEAIANELKGTGVTVTALCPGPTKTGFQETVSADSSENKISFNMGCAKQVAAYGYKAMLRGKSYAIPGRFNKFLAVIPRFVSRRTATSIVRRIQEKNRETV